MLSVHNVKVESPAQPNITRGSTSDKPPKKKSKPLTEYFSVLESEGKTLHATLAHLTTSDGLSFNVICSSTGLCAALTAMEFRNLPASVNTIFIHVVEYSKKIRLGIIHQIESHKKAELGVGERFSLSIDKWTSLQNCCYMSIYF